MQGYSLLVTDQLGCTNSVGPITIGSLRACGSMSLNYHN